MQNHCAVCLKASLQTVAYRPFTMIKISLAVNVTRFSFLLTFALTSLPRSGFDRRAAPFSGHRHPENAGPGDNRSEETNRNEINPMIEERRYI